MNPWFGDGRVIVDIQWPPFPNDIAMLGHPATEGDIAAGRAGFVLRDNSGRLVGVPVKMGIARLGFIQDGNERRLGAAVQVEAVGERCMVGVRHADGRFSVCSSREFESAPRFLVLYHKPGFGLDQAERAFPGRNGRRFSVARRGEVLAMRWSEQGPVLFVRHAAGDLVGQEVALMGEKNQQAAGLSKCDALFEVTFLDLEATLDEINTLIEAQRALEEMVGGFLFLGWNGHFEALGK